ncbi:hypothetical protein D3C87_1836590 [compost metagenome]
MTDLACIFRQLLEGDRNQFIRLHAHISQSLEHARRYALERIHYRRQLIGFGIRFGSLIGNGQLDQFLLLRFKRCIEAELLLFHRILLLLY